MPNRHQRLPLARAPGPLASVGVAEPVARPLRRFEPASVTTRHPRPAHLAPQYPLLPVAAVAAALGAIITLLLGVDPHANPDSYTFEAIARSLIAGHGFVYREPMLPGLPLYAFRSPGYSAFLALELLLGGVTAAVALQGAMLGVSAALVGDLAHRWAGARAAWIAFALRFVWPAGWLHAGQLTSEGLFEFLTILAVWLTVRAMRRHSLRWAALAGVVAGVSVLVRPTGLACAAAGAIWLLTRFPRGSAALALGALLAWSPWPIRNATRFHAFVPLLTSGGVAAWNIQGGVPPIVNFTWMSRHTGEGELGLDRHFVALTTAEIRTRPMAYARRTARALLDYVGPILDRGRGVWLHRFALLALLPLLPLLRWRGWRRRLALPALVWIGEGMLLVPLAMQSRYRFPSEWCVILCAAIGLETLASRWGARRTAWVSLGALAVCVAFTLVVARG